MSFSARSIAGTRRARWPTRFDLARNMRTEHGRPAINCWYGMLASTVMSTSKVSAMASSRSLFFQLLPAPVPHADHIVAPDMRRQIDRYAVVQDDAHRKVPACFLFRSFDSWLVGTGYGRPFAQLQHGNSMFACHIGVAGQELVQWRSIPKELEQEPHGDARPREHGSATHPVWIGGDERVRYGGDPIDHGTMITYSDTPREV